MALWELFGKQKSARELILAGQHKAALKVLLDELKTKKNDPTLLMLTADVYSKLGKSEEAKDYYIRVGEFYGDQGFFNKAVAMFKKALNASPQDQTILDKLAGYNNKVPKYILDSRFLEAAKRGETLPPEQAPVDTIIPEEESEIDSPDSSSIPEDFPEEVIQRVDTATSIPNFMNEDLGANAVDIDISIEMLPEDIDFDTLHDVSEELSQQFAKTGGEGFERLAAPRSKRSRGAKRQEMVHQSQAGARKKRPPAAEIPVEEPTVTEHQEVAQEDLAQPETADEASMVFTSRHEETSSEQDAQMDFTSLDDALDTLFSSGSEKAPQREEHRRHWPLFRTMPDEIFQEFVLVLESRDFDESAWIVRQGEEGDEMFLVAYGQVEVLMDHEGTPTKIATLEEGDFFGEASLITGAPRNASVRAASPVNCLVLKRGDLRLLAPKHPPVIDSIKAIYKARVRQNAAR